MKLTQLPQWRWLPLNLIGYHDHFELELPGAWELPGSSGTYRFGKKKRTHNFVSYGNKIDSKRDAGY